MNAPRRFFTEIFLFCSAVIFLSCSGTPTDSGKNSTGKDTTKVDTVSGPANIHVALGIPTDATPDDDHYMEKFSSCLSYNKNFLVSNWVSWNLNASYYGDAERRSGNFIPDNGLPAGWYRVRHDDYTNSGYDRGHMVRSEERTRNRADNDSTFLMTNILPQYNDLNAGPWGDLENYCEDLCKKEKKNLFVIAGGIFSSAAPKKIGPGVFVPDKFYKIVVVLDSGQALKNVSASTRVIGVVMPNEKGIRTNDWKIYRSSVRQIEAAVGYNFLSAVPKNIQDAIEAGVDAQ